MNRQHVVSSRRGEKPTLPPDFASTLIATEFELDRNCSVETVTALVSLYQQAIEYYEHKGDSRFVDYQSRMHKMFLRPDVMEQLNKKVVNQVKTETPPQQKPRIPKLRKGEIPHDIQMNPPPMKQERKLEHIFVSHSERTQHASTQARKDVNQQVQSMSQRLAQRKMNKSSMDCSALVKRNYLNATFDVGGSEGDSGNVSFSITEELMKEEMMQKRGVSSPKINSGNTSRRASVRLTTEEIAAMISNSESDRSGGLPKMTAPKPIDDLAKQLEDVMERIYSERATREAEIRLKCESQIMEYQQEMSGSDLMTHLVENMRKMMQEEIDKLVLEMDERRKAEIRGITAKYAG